MIQLFGNTAVVIPRGHQRSPELKKKKKIQKVFAAESEAPKERKKNEKLNFEHIYRFKKMATTIQSDIRSALHVATLTILSRAAARRALQSSSLSTRRTTSFRLRAFSSSDSPTSDAVLKAPEKPSICTADEIHYVSVSNSDWRLALWRYHPSPQVNASHFLIFIFIILK